MISSPDPFKLTVDQIKQYHEQGYLGPYTLCTPEEMAEIRDCLANDIQVDANPHNQHCKHRIVYDLCAHPAIVQRMQSILGDSLVLWRSHFFVKNPGEKEVPWHQDANYWPIEPPLNISAWLAIDPAYVENSCVQLIPGSHRHIVPHIQADRSKVFKVFLEQADTQFVDTDKALPMELAPGQFFLFNERLLHYSAPNDSTQRRIGLAIRVTLPFVKVDDKEKLFLVGSGEDKFGINTYLSPPVVEVSK